MVAGPCNGPALAYSPAFLVSVIGGFILTAPGWAGVVFVISVLTVWELSTGQLGLVLPSEGAACSFWLPPGMSRSGEGCACVYVSTYKPGKYTRVCVGR